MPVFVNRSNAPQVFNLRHEIYCGDGPCSCTRTKGIADATSRKGLPSVKHIVLRACAVLTLLVGERKEVGARALHIPEIQEAIRRGLVSVEEAPKQAADVPMPEGLPATDRLRPGAASPPRARVGRRGKEE